MKNSILIFFCICLIGNLYCRDKQLVQNAKKDSVWIKKIFNEKQKAFAAKDTSLTFIKGDVYYTPDNLYKFGKVIASSQLNDYQTIYHYFNSVQYYLKNKLVEVEIPDSFDFDIRPVHNIYRLPYKVPAYLIINAFENLIDNDALDYIVEVDLPLLDNDTTATYTEPVENLKLNALELETNDNISFSSVTILFDQKRLSHFNFQQVSEYPTDDWRNKNYETETYPTFIFESKVISNKRYLQPYLRYDTINKQLDYLYLMCDNYSNRNCSSPFFKIYSGSLSFVDSIFNTVKDSIWFYPSLESFTDTVSVRNYNLNNIPIQVVATKIYEEVGEGILLMSHVYYQIGNTSIDNYSPIYDEMKETDSIKPVLKTLKDGSLILEITNMYTPNRSGMCGSCEYYNTEFWLIKKDTVDLIFTYSDNSNSSVTSYEYKNMSSRFYLIDDSLTYEEDAFVDSVYWKDNSTYVFHVSSDFNSRKFYLHFDKVGNTINPRIEVGELEIKEE